MMMAVIVLSGITGTLFLTFELQNSTAKGELGTTIYVDADTGDNDTKSRKDEQEERESRYTAIGTWNENANNENTTNDIIKGN